MVCDLNRFGIVELHVNLALFYNKPVFIEVFSNNSFNEFQLFSMLLVSMTILPKSFMLTVLSEKLVWKRVYSLQNNCLCTYLHFYYAICITKVCKSYTKQFFFYIFIYTSLLFCVTIKFYKRKKKKNFDTCKQCFPTVQLLTWHCSSIFVFLTCTCCNIDYIFWYWLPFWSQIELLHIQIIYMY